MARHDDATWLAWVLENIMAVPVAYDPSITMQSRDDLGALRLGLGHDSSFRRKHMRISIEFNGIGGIYQRLSVKLPIAWSADAAIPGFHVRLRLR